MDYAMEISVVLTVERPHTVIQTSPEWLEEFDLCAEEAIGRAPQTNTAELFELIKTARREARSSSVLTFYTRCGQSANYDVRAKCIYDADGRSVGCVLSLVRCEGMLRTLMRTGSRLFRTASIGDAHQGGDSRDTLVHGINGEEIEISAVVAVEKPYRILRTSPGWLGKKRVTSPTGGAWRQWLLPRRRRRNPKFLPLISPFPFFSRANVLNRAKSRL